MIRRPLLWLAVLSAPTFGLFGCASKVVAPVTDRTAELRVVEGSAAKPSPSPAEPENAGGYLIKKGDTLYSIALDHGVDYKDVARWNGLDNPNRIIEGRRLRLSDPAIVASAPESDGVVIKPILMPAPVRVKPLGDTPTTPAVSTPAGANTAMLKRAPKGGKIPYSDSALATIKEREGGVASSIASAPVAPPAVTVVPAAVPVPAPAPAPVAEPVTAPSALSWSWPATGKLTAPFADGSNKGIDIAGKIGDPVVAAGAGKVLYVGSNLRGYGKMVVVKHNTDYLSVYAHNSKALVSEGQSVTAGQKIAELGDSDTDSPKLHFEIRKQGKPVDPAGFLPAR
jgi:lipoprotein NlpD